MKTKLISKILLSLGILFVLGSAITQVHGQVVTIQSAGDVTRRDTGLFILTMNPPPPPNGGTYVNFSVSGTAVPGVDYVPLVSPAYIAGCGGNFCVPGVGLIAVKTLPDPRGSLIRQAYSVVVTLKPGLGYAVGQPSSAKMMINPFTLDIREGKECDAAVCLKYSRQRGVRIFLLRSVPSIHSLARSRRRRVICRSSFGVSIIEVLPNFPRYIAPDFLQYLCEK